MQIGVNRSLAPRNGRPKIPFLLFEFNKMLVMKNHHDRVSQRPVEILFVIPDGLPIPRPSDRVFERILAIGVKDGPVRCS